MRKLKNNFRAIIPFLGVILVTLLAMGGITLARSASGCAEFDTALAEWRSEQSLAMTSKAKQAASQKVDDLLRLKTDQCAAVGDAQSGAQSGATDGQSGTSQSGDTTGAQSGTSGVTGEASQSGATGNGTKSTTSTPAATELRMADYYNDGKNWSNLTSDPAVVVSLYALGGHASVLPALNGKPRTELTSTEAEAELKFVTGVDGNGTFDPVQLATQQVVLDSSIPESDWYSTINTKVAELRSGNQASWQSAIDALRTRLEGATYSVETLPAGSYNTTGVTNIADGSNPVVNFGDVWQEQEFKVLRITMADGLTRDLKLACMFQPQTQEATPGSTLPSEGPRDEYLVPTPPTEPPANPPTTPTPEPPGPTPTPTPEPKDPSEDPAQNGNAGNGGGQNEDSGPGEYIPPDQMEQPPAEDYTAPPQPEPDPTEPAPGADTGGSGTEPDGGDSATTEDGTDAGQPAQEGDVDPDD